MRWSHEPGAGLDDTVTSLLAHAFGVVVSMGLFAFASRGSASLLELLAAGIAVQVAACGTRALLEPRSRRSAPPPVQDQG